MRPIANLLFLIGIGLIIYVIYEGLDVRNDVKAQGLVVGGICIGFIGMGLSQWAINRQQKEPKPKTTRDRIRTVLLYTGLAIVLLAVSLMLFTETRYNILLFSAFGIFTLYLILPWMPKGKEDKDSDLLDDHLDSNQLK